MKVIILGSNGMLGSYLKQYLSPRHEVIALTRKDIDLCASESTILDFLRKTVSKNDVILNAAGVIKQRGNTETLPMIMANSVFPHILAKLKQEIGCTVVHITTDCVFSGIKGGYTESDKHDCTDDYGKTKSLGENEALTNIRTSIIGEEIANKKSLLEWVRSNTGNEIDGYENHLWNGVTCLELAKLIDTIIKDSSYWTGVRHVFSPDTVSKYELVSIINKVYDLGITINKKSVGENCYRDLKTVFTPMIFKTISEQIAELKEFKLS